METKEFIYSFKKHFFQVRLDWNITWSKFMALLVLISAVWIEVDQETKGVIFIASLPFITFLISGRWIKEVKEDNNKLKATIEKDKLNKS